MPDKGDVGGAPEHIFRVEGWFLAFKQSTSERLARWFTLGQRFKHVMCFGFVPAAGCWVFYDWSASQAGLWIVPTEAADRMLARAQDDAVVVRFVPPLYILENRFKPGQWCTVNVAHLVGVRSCALRPDRLFADCIRQGGTIVAESPEWRPPRSNRTRNWSASRLLPARIRSALSRTASRAQPTRWCGSMAQRAPWPARQDP